MRISKSILSGLAAGVLAVSVAYAEGDQYVLSNQTGVTIDELYVSASETEEWGDDILGQETLADGESGELTFHADDDRCLWDIAIKDSDEQRIQWNGVDLCKYTHITLKPDGVAEVE